MPVETVSCECARQRMNTNDADLHSDTMSRRELTTTVLPRSLDVNSETRLQPG